MIVECHSVKCVFNIRQVSHSCADAGFEYIFPVRFMVRLHRDQSQTYWIDAIHIEAREGRQTVGVIGFKSPYLKAQGGIDASKGGIFDNRMGCSVHCFPRNVFAISTRMQTLNPRGTIQISSKTCRHPDLASRLSFQHERAFPNSLPRIDARHIQPKLYLRPFLHETVSY